MKEYIDKLKVYNPTLNERSITVRDGTVVAAAVVMGEDGNAVVTPFGEHLLGASTKPTTKRRTAKPAPKPIERELDALLEE